MSSPKNISISNYTYVLPDERIAAHPLDERDASKLLIYEKGNIKEDIYRNIAQHLSPGSLLIFNDTKVIRARLRFQKQTGGVIEIFCLEPHELLSEYQTVMNKTGAVKWKCMIGGASKWKSGILEKTILVHGKQTVLTARLVEKLSDAWIAEFSWQPADLSFAEILEAAGDIPLPPYIKRSTEIEDTERYQTIYANEEGSVAAPTAGLHFTKHIMEDLSKKKIEKDFVTLHVGAGTFKPVKAENMEGHEMHAEWIDVRQETIQNISTALQQEIVAVGTTSLRTIESLYWLGVKAHQQPSAEKLELGQWEVYDELAAMAIPAKDALNALLSWMRSKQLERLFTQTQVLIAPGYQFKIVKTLITNFHQPGSTLLLLVAAAVGDSWKKIYSYAMKNDFRFLSYGDGCLLKLDQNQ